MGEPQEMKKNQIKTFFSGKNGAAVTSVQPVLEKRNKKQEKDELRMLQEENLFLKIQNKTLQEEKLSLTLEAEKMHQKESSRYVKVFPLWQQLYYSDPGMVKEIADQFLVNPTNPETRGKIHTFDAVLEAFLKALYFSFPTAETFEACFEKKEQERKSWEERYRIKEKEVDRLKEALKKEKETLPIHVSFGSDGPVWKVESPHTVVVEKGEMEREEIEETEEETLQEETVENDPPDLSFGDEILFDTLPFPTKEEEDWYVQVLQEKGYEIKEADKGCHSKLVYYQDRYVPLCYFDYPIQNGAIFDEIMEDQKEIFIMFSDKASFDAGNTAFTLWKFRSRRHDIKFSFSMRDDVMKEGLKKLS